jgi:hypothetical protein
MSIIHRRSGLGRKAFLCVTLLTSFAHAAPDCIVTITDGIEVMTLNHGPVFDKERGYCLTVEGNINEGGNEIIFRTTYDSGKVSTFGPNDRKDAAVFETKGDGKSEYLILGGYAGDAWREDEYTRYLPRPSMPAYTTLVHHGKGKKTGEWFFSATFTVKEGSLQNRMRTYIGQLKAMGFTGDARNHELRSRDRASPAARAPDATAFLGYIARNNAGFLVRASCPGPRLCHVSLDNPRKAQREARESAARKAKAEKERRRKRKFDDDFSDFVDSLPDK